MASKLNRKGGCHMSYADIDTSYMLSPGKTTGGNAKKGGNNASYASVNTGYTLDAKKGGNATTPRENAKGGSGCRACNRKGGNSLVLPPAFDNLGSAMNNMVLKKGGKPQQQKGGVFVELSPILTSLILLGARAAADKSFNQNADKKLGSVSFSSSRKSPKDVSKPRSKY